MADAMDIYGGSPLAGLPRLRNCTSRRASSWDRTGGNRDRLHIAPGQTAVLAELQGLAASSTSG